MKIGFLGDSITFGYGLANRERDRYAALVCRELGCEQVNLGVTGTLVARAGLSRDNGVSFLDRLPLLEGCDRAVVFGGTNDYFWSDAPLYGEGLDCFAPAVDFLCCAAFPGIAYCSSRPTRTTAWAIFRAALPGATRASTTPTRPTTWATPSRTTFRCSCRQATLTA